MAHRTRSSVTSKGSFAGTLDEVDVSAETVPLNKASPAASMPVAVLVEIERKVFTARIPFHYCCFYFELIAALKMLQLQRLEGQHFRSGTLFTEYPDYFSAYFKSVGLFLFSSFGVDECKWGHSNRLVKKGLSYLLRLS
ncbi:hypothetical protein [Endozoicomonas numazuensis]|uniref:hypothetical protein n=1 Tax=Endozoicomonas numazuensis TaxID=1137799 RepID=UPI001F326E70|nr:hypothetical protein [Endozoicomonas numazuensis]